MAQGAELRIHGLRNFSWETATGQAGRLAPFSAVAPAVKIIDEDIHVGPARKPKVISPAPSDT